MPWLMFSKLGDCFGWFLILEKDFFLGKPESVLPTFSMSLTALGLMTSWSTCFPRGPSGVLVGKVPGGSLLWQLVLFFLDLASRDYFLSQFVDPQVLLLPQLLG